MNKNALGQFDSVSLALLSAGLDINGDLNDPVFSSLFPVYVELNLPEPNFAECLKPFTTSRTPVSGDTPGNRYFETNSCKVSTIGLLEGNELQISLEKLISDLKMNEGCKDLEPKMQVGDQDIAANVATISANESAQLKLVFKVSEKSTECDLMQFEGVEFLVLISGESEFAKVAIEFNFQQPPDIRSVRLLTIALVLLAALLSLVLFRLISSALAVMPKAHTVYSYDKDIEIGQNAFGQVQVLIDGIDLVNYVPSVDDLSKPLSSSSKSQLDLNRVRLERKLGSFFKPLTEPWSELTKSQMASYWQQSPNGGLAIPFRRAIIVSKLENALMTDGRVRALLTIIVPTTGNMGGVSGVASLLVGQKTKDICKDFFEKAKSSGNGLDLSEKKRDGEGGAALPQGGVRPPGPPPMPKL